MLKKVVVSGLLGGIVFFVWTFIINGIFGFKSSMDMKQVPNERQVYAILKENILEPGRYICNPELTSAGVFPDEEPVFSILYGGVGHKAAGREALVQLPLFFIAPMIGAGMLSVTSGRVLASYPRKVLFFTAIGLLFAVTGDLMNFGIGDYPLNDALILAAHDVIVWTLVGLIVAWRMKPEPDSVAYTPPTPTV